MSTTQPNALRLAHIFDHPLPPEWPDMVAAAAELRRQHARIAELEARVQELGQMARDVNSRRVVELEAQLEAIGGVSPPEGMAGWMQGVEAASALLSKKAEDFAQEHGYDDMGGLSFGRGAHADAKLDYHSTLIELADEVRAMLPAPPLASEAKGAGHA